MGTTRVECGDVTLTVLTTEIEVGRYEELIAKEKRLQLLENAVLHMPYNSQAEYVKKVFDIKEVKE